MMTISFKTWARVAVLSTTLSLSAGGCVSDVTDLQPRTDLSEKSAFQTPERIALAVAGVYDAAQTGVYNGTLTSGGTNAARGYPFGAAHVQQGDMRGEDMTMTVGAAFFGFTYQSTYTPNTFNNIYMWHNLWRVINQANVVMAGLKTYKPDVALTQAQIDIYESECRVLRALAYHHLLIHFARPYADATFRDDAKSGFPYKTKAAGVSIEGAITIEQSAALPRESVASCYNKILEDLDFAEQKLPDVTAANRTNSIVRVTKGAAIALKTRVFLHMGKYSDVKQNADKLIVARTGNYSLTAAPMAAFSKNNTEAIFSIENNAQDNPGVNAGLATMLNGANNGRGLVCISPTMWRQPFWLASDARRAATTIALGGYRYVGKYTDAAALSDNAPIIRYAEVLLNAAEADLRLGNAASSLALLNQVRNRSVTSPTGQFGGSGTPAPTGDDLMRAILNERRVEFLGEGLRWLDIHRLATDAKFGTGGIPSKLDYLSLSTTNMTESYNNTTTLPMLALIPYSAPTFIWPVPADELAVGSAIGQNAGW
jgi:hypothetical protein